MKKRNKKCPALSENSVIIIAILAAAAVEIVYYVFKYLFG